jgi:murein L,D-transpeptidase YafK
VSAKPVTPSQIEVAKAEVARTEAARLEAERLAAERTKASKQASVRVEAEKVEAAKAEAARVAAAKAEADRAEAERIKASKLAEQRAAEAKVAATRFDAIETEAAKAEAARVAAAKAEAIKAEAAKAEAARIEAIKAEAAKAAAARAEAARIEAEKEAAARAEAARREAARIEAAKAEAARLETARAEAAKAEAAKAEAARIEAAKAEAARIEAARIEAIKAEAARTETAKAEAARIEAAKAEAARVAAAKAEAAARIEAARQEALRAEAARIEAARIEAAKADLLRMELQRAQVLNGAPAPATPAVAPAPVSDPAALGLEAWNAVQGWANAWMARNADAFLGYYASSFTPEDGSPRQTWEDRRKQYFERVKQISVNLDNPVIDVKDGNHVDVRFVQSFSSDIYREGGKPKTLSLEKQLGHWKIIAEQSGNAPKPKAVAASDVQPTTALPVTRAETEHIEAAKAEAARAETLRIETERLEAAKAQAIRLEAAKAEAANAETARIEAERAKTRLETAKAEAAKAEAAKAEAAKAEAIRAENARKDAAKAAEAAKEAALKARRDCLMSRKCREESVKLEESQAMKAGASKPVTGATTEAATTAPTGTKDMGPEVWKAVQSWAADWQAQDANKFIKHYDRHFAPEDGSGYVAWEKRRRDHFKRVKKIEVTLSNASVEVMDNNHATVSFTQDFRADNYHQVNEKTLVMLLTSTGWLITAEHSLPAREDVAKAEAARTQALKAEAERNEALKAEAARVEAARAEAARLRAEEAAKPHPAKVDVAKVETSSPSPAIKAEVVPAKTASTDQSFLAGSAVQVAKAWAQAWEAKDVDGYLSYYSPNFKPAGGESLAAWELQRRARITKARSLDIKLEGLMAKLLDDTHAQVSFTQHYRAEHYQDTTHKVLDMVRSEQGWQITQERTDTASAATEAPSTANPKSTVASKPAKGKHRQ